MSSQGYTDLRRELYSLISKTDAQFAALSDYDKIIYLLKLGNSNIIICKLSLGRYIHFMFQRTKAIIITNTIK